jgi:hypothetical protein
MAAFQPAIWYPLTWIAILLPSIEGWNFLVIIQPIATMLFMYVFLRSIRFRRSIAVFGAFAYAFSGWMVVYWQEVLVLEHSFLWLPLALYASNRVWERHDDTLGFLLLTLALTCSVLGGFLQMAIYVFSVVLLWNIFCYSAYGNRDYSGSAARRIIASFFIALLISSVQLVPSFEAARLSPRETADAIFIFRNYLLSPQHLITLLAPDYWGNPAAYNYFDNGSGFYFEKMIFIGVIPLLFAVYGMLRVKKKQTLFWTSIALISLSLGFALPTSWLPYYLHIPVLSNSYPTRVFAVSAFSLIMLACFGLDAFCERPDRKRMAYILGCATVILAAGWAVVFNAWCIYTWSSSYAAAHSGTQAPWDVLGTMLGITAKNSVLYATVSLRNLIVPTLFVCFGWGLLLIAKFFKKFVFVTVCCLTVTSGFYFAQKYIYFGERRFMYPDLSVIDRLTALAEFDRVWGYGDAFIEKNLPEYFHWFSTDGYSNLSPTRYAELLTTINNHGRLGGAVRRSDTDLYEASERDPLTSNPYRLRMMSILGVKYILETKKGQLKDAQPTEKRFPPSLFSLAWENASWRIWQYMPALPRAIFATNILVFTRPQDIVDTLYDPSVNIGDTIMLEEQPPQTVQNTGTASSSAHIVSYGVNNVTITVDAQTAGYLVLTDNYYPGWHAKVDGKPAQIYRADYAFRAVYVPKGSSRVVFYYMPNSVIAGGILSGITVLGFVSFCFWQSAADQKSHRIITGAARKRRTAYK